MDTRIGRPMHHQGARASRGPTGLRRGDSLVRRHQPGPKKKKERKDQLGPLPKLAPWEATNPGHPPKGLRGDRPPPRSLGGAGGEAPNPASQ